jgi:hypothetical protein
MFSDDDRRKLKAALPDATDVEIFAIENRPALEALRALLSTEIAKPPEELKALDPVRLSGGPKQARVLLELARESGLQGTVVLWQDNGAYCYFHLDSSDAAPTSLD